MSDFRMKEVRALLNTTMESVLRRAMFEIMKIVENSLHDHQLELSQKGEEIVQLKVKLQRTELRLRDALYTNDQVAPMEDQLGQSGSKGEPEDVRNATTQKLVPETDFETVPEDWCAPVGYEMPAIPDEGSCPSVRLRKLSIPLYPIPVPKQEEIHQGINSHHDAEGPRRSKRGSLPVQEGNQILNKSLTATDQKVGYKNGRSDIALLLQENEKLHVRTGLRGRRTNSSGNQQEIPSTRDVRESALAKIDPAEQQTVENDNAKTHHCKFCKAPFDSEFGRDVHERYHKWCRGCKNFFSSLDSLMSHKSQCKRFIALLAKKARSKAASGPLSCNTKKQTKLHHKLVNDKQDSPANNIASVIQNDIKKYSCVVCNKKFISGAKQKEHMRVHTGEKPFFCSLCPKKFRVKQSLKDHLMRVHKSRVNSRDLVWTDPMNEESVPPGKDMSASLNRMKLSRKKAFGLKGKSLGLKECGAKVLGGFRCNVCSKVVKTKYALIEHYRVHTREKPFECPCCKALFRYRGQFSGHYKKCKQSLCDKGKSNLPTDSPVACNVEEKVSLSQDASENT